MQPQKWQRNSLYEAVVAGGLDAGECRFVYDDAEWRITHVPSQSYFLVQGSPSRYTTTAVVGDSLPMPSRSFTWTALPENVQRWAGEVRRDVDTPDLWAELRRRQGIVTRAGYEDVVNTPFTPLEQEQILHQLREIQELVRRTESLSEAQTSSTMAKLDDITAAASRVGRKDWQLMFGGMILSLIMDQLLPHETVSSIIEIVSDGLGQLFGGGHRLLPLPIPPPPPTVV